MKKHEQVMVIIAIIVLLILICNKMDRLKQERELAAAESGYVVKSENSGE